MKEIKNILINNNCYKAGGKMIEIRGVLWHSTATPGATPESFVKSWNTGRPGGRQVCVHSFSDDTKVIQTLPYNMRCWGCGSGNKGSGNNYYIQNEICEPSGIYFDNGWQYKIKAGKEKEVKQYIINAVDVLVEWTVNRLLELGIKEVNKKTVTSHYEAHAMGIACNHSDPSGLLSLVGLTMDDVRNKCDKLMKERIGSNDINKDIIDKVNDDIINKVDDNNIKVGDTVIFKDEAIQWNGKTIPSTYKSKEYTVKEIADSGRTVLTINNTVMYAVDKKYLKVSKNNNNITDTSYKIRVTCDELNIRKGPGTSYAIVMCIRDRGVYTIVDVDDSGKWGKLKSGAGWIHLNYTEKI